MLQPRARPHQNMRQGTRRWHRLITTMGPGLMPGITESLKTRLHTTIALMTHMRARILACIILHVDFTLEVSRSTTSMERLLLAAQRMFWTSIIFLWTSFREHRSQYTRLISLLSSNLNIVVLFIVIKPGAITAMLSNSTFLGVSRSPSERICIYLILREWPQ